MPVTMPRTAAEYRSYLADLLAEVHGQMRRHEKLLAGAWLICTDLMTWHSTANLLHKYETPTAVHNECIWTTTKAQIRHSALLRLWIDKSTTLFQLSLGQTKRQSRCS